MKTRTFFSLFLLLLASFVQAENVNWTFATEGKIHSTTAIENGIAYIGSDDQKLYAINVETGAQLWSYKTEYAVKSIPLVLGNSIYITAGSSLHRISKDNGAAIKIYNSEAVLSGTPKSFIDEWDYHTSSAFEYNGKIFFGDQFGNIQIYDTVSNEGAVYYTTDQGAAIRTTVNVVDSVMYFGDWDGMAYALDMKTKELKWEYKSFDEKPYASFGAYVTQPIIHNNKLYMGARNYTFAVIDIANGTKVWDYTHAGGGWITGTPLFVNDTLYLGGSDNKEMIAFNPETGDKHWVLNTKQNVFCEAAYVNGKILFTDGDSYNHNSGKGYLYALDAKSGKVKNLYALNTNVYSSPKIIGNKIIFGGYDNKVYCFDLNNFIKPETTTFEFPDEPTDQLTINNQNTDCFILSIQNKGDGIDTLSIQASSTNQQLSDAVYYQSEVLTINVNEKGTAKIKIKKDDVSSGTYDLTITATSKTSGDVLYSKTCQVIIPEATKLKENSIKGFNIYPNPVEDVLNCHLQLSKNANVELTICALDGKRILSKQLGIMQLGEHSLSVNLDENMNSGTYVLAVKVNDESMVQTKLFRLQ